MKVPQPNSSALNLKKSEPIYDIQISEILWDEDLINIYKVHQARNEERIFSG